MDTYTPADTRASLTLKHMITPYTSVLSEATSIREITNAIIKYLPPGIAYGTELRVKMIRGENIIFLRNQASLITIGIILRRVCEGLPSIITDEGNREIYYMREDLLRWYHSNPINAKYFMAPQDEIITVEIHTDDRIKTAVMKLTEDQMIGVAYGLNGMNDNKIILHSSITNAPVEIDKIVDHALIYRLPIILATERLKRPFSVEILRPDKLFITVYFVNPEFMQGVLSVAQWYKFPDNGNGILWKNLYQFTREGMIPLRF